MPCECQGCSTRHCCHVPKRGLGSASVFRTLFSGDHIVPCPCHSSLPSTVTAKQANKARRWTTLLRALPQGLHEGWLLPYCFQLRTLRSPCAASELGQLLSAPASMPPVAFLSSSRREGGKERPVHLWPNGSLGLQGGQLLRVFLVHSTGCSCRLGFPAVLSHLPTWKPFSVCNNNDNK